MSFLTIKLKPNSSHITMSHDPRDKYIYHSNMSDVYHFFNCQCCLLLKNSWVSTLVGEHLRPRVPSKTAIIKKNLHLLHANVINKEIFPPRTIISADRKRKNLAQMYKPTVPQRYVQHGPKNRPGFFSLQRKVRHVSPFKRNYCSCISVGR